MHIHILGICGTFMGGLAALAREAGHRVTGCDAGVYPPMSDQLRALGIELIEGYGADQLAIKPDMFVVGNTVSRGRTETGAAKFPLIEAILDAGAPYTSGPQWLAEHVLQGRHVLAVAGTHGKTTTTAMLTWILECAGLGPGFLVGGVPLNFGVSARLGAPTLPASRGSLPPEGADSPWGGPAGNRAPTLPASRGSLPPEGADSPWDGPAGNRAPTLPASRGSLPPEGADSLWGGPAGNLAPPLPASRGSLPPEGGDSSSGGPFFVIEADEYDTAFFDKRSKFVHYRPRTAVLNNLEFDHADIFDSLADIERQFHHLVRTVPGSGRIVVNGLEESLARVLHRGCWSEVRSFGSAADDFSHLGEPDDFLVLQGGQPVARVQWTLNGVHNQLNALAAIAAAAHVGVPPAEAAMALARFENVKRRMEVRARFVLSSAPNAAPVTIYDDFAHHPTAIRTTVNGLRRSVGSARILAVFEPRSNTMKLGTMKAQLPWSLEEVDLAFCHGGGLGWDATQALSHMGERACVAPTIDALAALVAAQVRPGDHILCMSNGGFGGVHDKIAAQLRSL